MHRLILLLTFCLLSSGTEVFACSCEYQGSFMKMSQHTPLVALVKVSKYLTFKNIQSSSTPSKTPMSMEVEIIEIYKGKETRKSVIVWGDNGILCRPYLSEFNEHQYYVIALDTGGRRGHADEKNTDYSISICGAYWLTADLQNSTVTGDIDSKDRTSRTTGLTDLRSMLAKGQPVYVLSLKDQDNFSEKNTFTFEDHITLIQQVQFDKPTVLDEEYWITLTLTIIDTVKAKQVRLLHMRDTSVVKCVFGHQSAWQWKKRDTEISGRIIIKSWTNESIEVELDIEVFDYNFRRSYFYNQKRTFLKAKKTGDKEVPLR